MSSSACVYVHMWCFMHHPDLASLTARLPACQPPQWLLRSALKQPPNTEEEISPSMHPQSHYKAGQGEPDTRGRGSTSGGTRQEVNNEIKRLKQKDEIEKASRKKRLVEWWWWWWGGGHWLCSLKPDRSGISKDKPSYTHQMTFVHECVCLCVTVAPRVALRDATYAGVKFDWTHTQQFV